MLSLIYITLKRPANIIRITRLLDIPKNFLSNSCTLTMLRTFQKFRHSHSDLYFIIIQKDSFNYNPIISFCFPSSAFLFHVTPTDLFPSPHYAYPRRSMCAKITRIGPLRKCRLQTSYHCSLLRNYGLGLHCLDWEGG